MGLNWLLYYQFEVFKVDDQSEAITSFSVPRKLQRFSFSLFLHLLLHCKVANQLLLKDKSSSVENKFPCSELENIFPFCLKIYFHFV